MQTIKTGIGQSIFDIAVQHTGTVEAAMDIALANGIAVDSELATGQILNHDHFVVVNKMILEYYLRNAITPATGLAAAQAPGEGIGFWIIENDFIIQ